MTTNNNIGEMVSMAMKKGSISYDEKKRMIEALTRDGTDPDEAELLLDAAIQEAEQKQREHTGKQRCPKCGTESDAFVARCTARIPRHGRPQCQEARHHRPLS